VTDAAIAIARDANKRLPLGDHRRPVALVLVADRAPTSTRHVVLHPVSLAVLLLAICAAASIAGVLGAVLTLPVVAVAGAGLASLGPVQRAAVRYRTVRARGTRERERLARLLPAGPVRQHEYRELRGIVNQIEHTDPDDARRYELEQLLDDFVQIASIHERYQRVVLNSATVSEAWPNGNPHQSVRARELVSRRIRHRQDCQQRCEHLADQLEVIDQLVRLVAQRAACPPLDDDLDTEIDRRLSELGEVDAALAQLSA